MQSARIYNFSFCQQVARITYKSVNDECGAVGNPFFEIDRKGLLVTYNKYGIGELEITSVEDNDFIQVHRVPVKVSREITFAFI